MKDSHLHALEWEAENVDRTVELNDLLDACSDMKAQRTLFRTFTKEERSGLMPERLRRLTNKLAPVGSLVRSSNKFGFSIMTRTSNSTFSASYNNIATVLAAPAHGSTLRYVMLHVPWQDREGRRITFAEANCYDLEVVT